MSDQPQPSYDSTKKDAIEHKPLPPIKHLPLRKRLAMEATIKTPKPESPKVTAEEYPPTPGSHSSGGSSESTIPIVHSPPQPPPEKEPEDSEEEETVTPKKEETLEQEEIVYKQEEKIKPAAAAFLLKKQPLKKAYNNLVSAAAVAAASKGKSILPIKKGLPGNPLLFKNTEQYAPEDTIDSFKSAWLGSEDDENDDEEEEEKEKVVEHKAYLIKKSNSSSSTVNKRGRPPVAKRSYSNDVSTVKKDDDYQVVTKIRKNNSANRSTMDGKLYCVCRQPYDATRFMIACDRCDDWFHGECIGINEKESEFVDLYFCTKCSKITGKKTSWKPKCANPACHKAARIGSHLGHLSKYCSDSCGMQVARARLELVEIKRRQNNDPSPVPIAQLALMKQRQLRTNSFADKEDKKRLSQIREEKKLIRDHVQAIDRKFKLFDQVTKDKEHHNMDHVHDTEEEHVDDGPCGFDSRLVLPDKFWRQKDNMEEDYSVCQDLNCTKHAQWQKIISLEFEQERKEQFKLLLNLEKERKQIKSRMRKRRSEKDMMKDLVNGTISA